MKRLLILFLLLATPCFADSVTFQNTVDCGALCAGAYAGCADTHLDEGNTSTNYGAGSTLEIKSNAGSNEHMTIMRWDLSDIPAGATISAVDLELKIQYTGTTNHYVHKVMREDWVEAEATWTDYKSSTAWSTAGGRHDGNDIDGTYGDNDTDLGEDSYTVADDETYVTTAFDADGVTYVQAEFDDDGIIDIMISQDQGDDVSVGFDSCDSASTDSPKLTITYTEAAPGGARRILNAN